MTKDKKLLVAAIKDGTVIDHINSGHALKIIRLLNLASYSKLVTVGLNLPSKESGLKDLIKVANLELTPEEMSRVAIFAPNATINIIKDYTVSKKFKAEIPEVIEYVIVCPNPKCITNHEDINTKFHIECDKGKTKFSCNYCEKKYEESDIKEYKHN